MAVVVTGASGLLGHALLRTLGERALPLHGKSACDLSDASALTATLQRVLDTPGVTVDGVVHAAAFTSVDAAEKEHAEAFRSNVLATRNVCRWAAEHRVPLVYTSTASVFDGDVGNYRPSDVPFPRNYYSWTKLLGEESVLAHGGRVARLTVIGVHPTRRTPGNFLEWLSENLATKRTVTLYRDARINPLSPGTAAETLLSVLHKAGPSTLWHLGAKDVISKAELGRAWQQRHFPQAGACIKVTALGDCTDSAPRGRELWLDVSATEALHPMPLCALELDRCSTENPPWI